MQNRNPSHNKPSHPSIFDQLRAHARACLGSERPPTDPGPVPISDPGGAGERSVDELIDGAEVLRVIREPIEWILELAHQLAGGDPVDVAAIARLRAAFYARLAGQSALIRKRDLLTAFGLLLGALDPSVVGRAVADTIGDGLAEVIGAAAPVAIEIADTLDPLASLAELIEALRPRRSAGPRPVCSLRSPFVR